MEQYLLEYLCAYKEYQTLSAAAEALHVAEPSLSRSMKKLEGEIGVSLFNRTKNRITLNENGELAAEYAKRILADTEDMIAKVRALDRSRRTISVGACTPSACFLLSPYLNNAFPHMAIMTETADTEQLLPMLRSGLYQMVVLPFPAEDQDLYCVPCGEEQLCFAVPPEHEMAGLESVTYEDIDGINMLLYADIGFWYDLTVQKMPHSRFLTQSDSFTFQELLDASVLPSFSTSLGKNMMGINSQRVEIPITDPEATVHFHCVCLRSQRTRLKPFFVLLDSASR
jgi:DNA-binding transcriptional LysR family regulator